MQLYRGVIRPVTSFGSPLQSDTLFGAFCWSYRYCYGEAALSAMLQAFENEPQIIFSNAFPKGTLPLPIGIFDPKSDFTKIKSKEEKQQAFQKRKKTKNARYVTREWFERIQQGELSGFAEGLRNDGVKELTVMHNMVSRDTGVVQKDENGGNLYEEGEFFPDGNTEYDIYVLSSMDSDVLKKTIETMLLLGIGKNKSVGKGSFELKSWEKDNSLLNAEKGNAFVALSNFVPAQSDPTDGRYKTLVKYGKMDRSYAMDETPFKKPILFLQAGARFHTEEVREYYGKLLKNIVVRPEVVVNAYTIAVPICWSVEQ